MAEILTRREFPYEGCDLACPVCHGKIDIVAVVDTKSGSVTNAGSRNFDAPILTVNLNTKVVQLKISHACEIKDEEI